MHWNIVSSHEKLLVHGQANLLYGVQKVKLKDHTRVQQMGFQLLLKMPIKCYTKLHNMLLLTKCYLTVKLTLNLH